MDNNTGNLKDISKRADHKQLSAKGGIKSGESKRRKKLLRDCCDVLATMQVTSEARRAILKQAGIAPDDMTNQMAMAFALMQQATNGDVRAFEAFRDTMGQKPKDEISFEAPTKIIFEDDFED